MMSTREAFNVFIRFQLNAMVEDGKINLSADEIEQFMLFYDQLSDFIAEICGKE